MIHRKVLYHHPWNPWCHGSLPSTGTLGASFLAMMISWGHRGDRPSGSTLRNVAEKHRKPTEKSMRKQKRDIVYIATPQKKKIEKISTTYSRLGFNFSIWSGHVPLPLAQGQASAATKRCACISTSGHADGVGRRPRFGRLEVFRWIPSGKLT
jgi:hypothetical protein